MLVRDIYNIKKMSRIQSTRFFLTYKTHLDKDEYKTWMEEKKATNFIRLAHETGSEGDYAHTHVLMELKEQLRTSDMGWFDYKEIHPNIEYLRPGKAWRARLKYIAKEDVANQDLDIIHNIREAKTLNEAFDCMTELKEAASVKLVWEARPQKRRKTTKINKEDFYPWQKVRRRQRSQDSFLSSQGDPKR